MKSPEDLLPTEESLNRTNWTQTITNLSSVQWKSNLPNEVELRSRSQRFRGFSSHMPIKRYCSRGQKRNVVLKHLFPQKTASQTIGKAHEEVTSVPRGPVCLLCLTQSTLTWLLRPDTCQPFITLMGKSLALVKEMPINTSKTWNK